MCLEPPVSIVTTRVPRSTRIDKRDVFLWGINKIDEAFAGYVVLTSHMIG